uniref:Putative secreted protein n=1 Tax=Rhipicephalus microplus TaxID=6941 RepID=A0A6G5A0I5_RHIMP
MSEMAIAFICSFHCWILLCGKAVACIKYMCVCVVSSLATSRFLCVTMCKDLHACCVALLQAMMQIVELRYCFLLLDSFFSYHSQFITRRLCRQEFHLIHQRHCEAAPYQAQEIENFSYKCHASSAVHTTLGPNGSVHACCKLSVCPSNVYA